MTDEYTGDLNVGGTLVTCSEATAHYATGCELLLHYANGDGDITTTEVMAACADYNAGIITLDEVNFISACWALSSPNVNNKCPGCHCFCTSWVNEACTAVGKRRQTRTCTPAGCDTESRIIDDASCATIGDITAMSVDGINIPEGGTVKWVLYHPCEITLTIKNVGLIAGTFYVKVTDEDGVILCSGYTPDISAGSSVDVICGTFTPTVIETKTLTATVTP